jgi:threonine/homoserine/homoserine lactone efflux protein
MNLAVIGLSSFLIALSGALVPGPLFTITVSESARRGASAGPLIILGHALLEILIVLLVLAGLSPFLSHDTTRHVVGLIGGFMLVLMGLLLLRDAPKVRLELSAGGKGRGMNLVLTGAVGSITNPYWVIWWATIGMGYLVSSLQSGVIGVVIFFLGHITADLAWYSLVSYAVSRGRKIMGDRGYRAVLFCCGIFLILFGGWFIKAS